MSRKRPLALLLIAVMIFTMNTGVFASDIGDETFEEQYVYGDHGKEFSDKVADKVLKAAEFDCSQTLNALAQGVVLKCNNGRNGFRASIDATRKKIKTSALYDFKYKYNNGTYWTISANGYRVPVKKIKITKNGIEPGDTIEYRLADIQSWKYVVDKDGNKLSKDEAKRARKSLKESFNKIKDLNYQCVIYPYRLAGVISANYVNGVMKNKVKGKIPVAVAIDYENGWRNMHGLSLVDNLTVTTVNGQITKVQIGKLEEDKHGNSDSEYVKVKFRTLKKNKEYHVSGNMILIDGLSDYYVEDDYLQKHFVVNF